MSNHRVTWSIRLIILHLFYSAILEEVFFYSKTKQWIWWTNHLPRRSCTHWALEVQEVVQVRRSNRRWHLNATCQRSHRTSHIRSWTTRWKDRSHQLPQWLLSSSQRSKLRSPSFFGPLCLRDADWASQESKNLCVWLLWIPRAPQFCGHNIADNCGRETISLRRPKSHFWYSLKKKRTCSSYGAKFSLGAICFGGS